MSKLVTVIGPVGTRSGYGSHARDIVISLLDLGYNVKTLTTRWGNTPQNALTKNTERDKRILDTLVFDGKIERQPDIHFHISIPTEFNPIGKLNVGITAGIEWTVPNPEWVLGMNKMDLNIVPSNFVKQVMGNSIFDQSDQQGNKVGELKSQKPIEVLFEGYDESIYSKPDSFSESLHNELSSIKEDFNFLYTGHWLPGPFGQDRKDTAGLVKLFIEAFADMKNAPGLIMKTSCGTFSPPDKYELIKKIDEIRRSHTTVPLDKQPKIYLLHGELSDVQMNELNYHPKVKAMISLTKGEGFGRPLLEFSTTGKPIIATNFSGHTDFLDADMSLLLGGNLTPVHEQAIPAQYRHKDSKWFTVDYQQANFAIKDVFTSYDKYLTKGYAQKQISSQFTHGNMTKKLGEILKPYEDKISEHVGINLPKLQKVNKPNEVKLPKLKKV